MAEPTKLTQAQALFAVLAGAAQSRRERVYYRDGVLRSTIYSPWAYEDRAVNSHSFAIDVEVITAHIWEPADYALSSHALSIEILVPSAPKPEDFATNTHSIAITPLLAVTQTPSDEATNTHTLAVTKYDGVYFTPKDTATNTHTIQVTVL